MSDSTPMLLGSVPGEFILFALVLAGIALLQRYTLEVALTGLVAVTFYKLEYTGFAQGPGLAGLAGLLAHEWVILVNLFGLLMGFALLSKHFEDSNVPVELPKPPLQSLTWFKYVDYAGTLQTLSSASYLVSTGKPGRIQPVWGNPWPIPRPQIDAVQIRFVCGYGDTAAAVDENVKQAMLVHIGGGYENHEPTKLERNTMLALLGPSDHGAYS